MDTCIHTPAHAMSQHMPAYAMSQHMHAPQALAHQLTIAWPAPAPWRQVRAPTPAGSARAGSPQPPSAGCAAARCHRPCPLRQAVRLHSSAHRLHQTRARAANGQSPTGLLGGGPRPPPWKIRGGLTGLRNVVNAGVFHCFTCANLIGQRRLLQLCVGRPTHPYMHTTSDA